MAIEVLLTGTVISQAKEYMHKEVRRVKVTLEARDGKGERVNVLCSSANERITGSLEVLEIGQSACVRGHTVVPINAKQEWKQPRIEVYVTDVIIL